MIFSSYSFIFLYLPIVLLGYHLLRRLPQPAVVKAFLIAASLVFYGVGQRDYLFMFVLSMVLNYLLAVGIAKCGKKWVRVLLLLAAVVWNIGLLVYFKYTNFLLEIANLLFGSQLGALDLILPIGISFYTFQILSYTIDLFREETELADPLDYFLFISFFPQLIVGPVVRHNELIPQLTGDRLRSFDPVNLYRGVMLFSVGCAKKILLANPLIDFATAFYGGTVTAASTVEAWVGVLAFTFAYYFDFSGYIDMARGLGCLFGVELPINFDSPYKARDFADFWRRWNMTISRFFHETVFANLFHFGDRIPKLIFATLATFAVSGLWHGADWHYIAWGIVNGVLVCIANIGTLKRIKLPKALGCVVTFVLSVLVRVLFDANGMTQALQVYRRLFSFTGWRSILPDLAGFVPEHLTVVILLVVGALICFCLPNSNRISEKTEFRARDAVFSAVLLMLSIFYMSQVSTFLYFNF